MTQDASVAKCQTTCLQWPHSVESRTVNVIFWVHTAFPSGTQLFSAPSDVHMLQLQLHSRAVSPARVAVHLLDNNNTNKNNKSLVGIPSYSAIELAPRRPDMDIINIYKFYI